ncbi:MAG: TIGR03936 family radical SAM-associated protein [Oscillospiraceae bacterium]|nr:TIGR03936 family radical SAM-associated protein [Oscillospiraceae bacterium]
MSRLLFAKQGRAKYISHLDLMHTFQRAFQRAGLDIAHTEGFNPHPFISLLLPLPLGFSSECEILDFRLLKPEELPQVPERLNAALPEGIRALECYEGGRKAKELAFVDYHIEMEWPGGQPLSAPLGELLGRDRLEVVKKSAKAKTGERIVEIISLVKSFNLTDAEGWTVLDTVLAAQNPGLNPQLITAALAREYPDETPSLVRYHRRAALGPEGEPFR